MFTKLQLACAKILSIGDPITRVIKADQEVGEDKVKSVQQAASALNTVLKKVLGPIFTIIGVAAVIYAIYLGILYAKAESADKRKEIQGRLIGACIGAVIIIAGATICFALNWTAIYHNFSITGHTFVDANNDGLCDSCK